MLDDATAERNGYASLTLSTFHSSSWCISTATWSRHWDQFVSCSYTLGPTRSRVVHSFDQGYQLSCTLILSTNQTSFHLRTSLQYSPRDHGNRRPCNTYSPSARLLATSTSRRRWAESLHLRVGSKNFSPLACDILSSSTTTIPPLPIPPSISTPTPTPPHLQAPQLPTPSTPPFNATSTTLPPH